MSWMYAPAAGATRCFLVGCGFSGVLSVLRVSLRPGCGIVHAGRPSSAGLALAGFCLTWHGVRLTLSCIGGAWSPRAKALRAAVAGAIAGSSLTLLHPAVAGLHTELHTAATLTGLRLAYDCLASWLQARLEHAGHAGHAGHAAATPAVEANRAIAQLLLPVLKPAPACIAGWYLLVQHTNPAPRATGALPAGVSAWLASLTPVAGGGWLCCLPTLSTFDVVSTIAAAWQRGAAANLRAAVPGCLVENLLGERTGRRTTGCRGARHTPAVHRAEAAPITSPSLITSPTPPAAPAAPAPDALRHAHRFAIVRLLARDAAAAGGVSAAFAALVHGGCGACARGGWVAGLSLVFLRPSRRAELSARLCYQAALSAVVAAVRAAVASSASSLASSSASAAATARGERAVRALGAVLLGGAAAIVLHAHAPDGNTPAASAAADVRMARVTCFLLGFDEDDDEGQQGEAGPAVRDELEEPRPSASLGGEQREPKAAPPLRKILQG